MKALPKQKNESNVADGRGRGLEHPIRTKSAVGQFPAPNSFQARPGKRHARPIFPCQR